MWHAIFIGPRAILAHEKQLQNSKCMRRGKSRDPLNFLRGNHNYISDQSTQATIDKFCAHSGHVNLG